MNLKLKYNSSLNNSIESPELQVINDLAEVSADEPESDMYFYHSDHLGSSSWITDASGSVNQHLQYLPFGEDYIYQRNTSWNIPYTFSGKEKDVETGYSYFGARYYDSDLSIWLSVDPLADKYPSMSAYMYTAGNPVMLVDPDGRKVEPHGKGREFRKNKRQIRKALRRAKRNNDQVFINNYKKWHEDKENSYYVQFSRGATELERAKPIETSATDQFMLYWDKKKRGKGAKQLEGTNNTTVEKELRVREYHRKKHMLFNGDYRFGSWFEWNWDTGKNKKFRAIGWGLGDHTNYNIFGFARRTNSHRPHATKPRGLVIRWGNNNFIGILYRSNKTWTKEETPKI